MAALNAGDEPALLATLHFPHYRLAGGKMQVWDQPGAYLADFLTRAGADWHHSEWDFRKVIAAGPAKVHLDVQFTRYRIGNSVIGWFRSLWIVTESGPLSKLSYGRDLAGKQTGREVLRAIRSSLGDQGSGNIMAITSAFLTACEV